MSFSFTPLFISSTNIEILYSSWVKALDVTEDDHLIDAYCGVGTIGFAFAKKSKV